MRAAEGIRIAQCVACRFDPRFCRATPKDEDRKGLCNKYESIFKEGSHDKGRSREEDIKPR